MKDKVIISISALLVVFDLQMIFDVLMIVGLGVGCTRSTTTDSFTMCEVAA